ncbi:MAG: transglutaminase domain-containing protein [Anaerohalosphaera sp.]|nr:transglutaminase domain-containing protein [Anaerohalosphaera sp.]
MLLSKKCLIGVTSLLAALLFCLNGCSDEPDPAGSLKQESETEYLAVVLSGKKLGYSKHTRNVDGGRVITTEKIVLDLSRAGYPIKMSIDQSSIESIKGKPLGFNISSDMSGMIKSETGKINDDGTLEITTVMMGQEQKKTIQYPKGALMSEGLRLLQLEHELKKGVKFSVKIFDTSIMGAMDAEIEVGDKVAVDLFGRVVELTEVTTKMGAITATSYIDDELKTLKTTVPIMGLKLELLACDKQFALSPNDVVDFIGSMLVQSPSPISADSKQTKYVLVPKDNKEITVPTTDNQKVVIEASNKVTVTVMPVSAESGEAFPYKGRDEKLLEMLKPTRYLQCDDRKVVALAEQAVEGAEDSLQAVYKIEQFVHDYIDEKDLSVGYASASEIAVSKQGDCSEHAVLTAAMCRAAGIPARVVTGLVYIDSFMGRENVLGGHAWTEAYVGGKWIGLDATKAPKGCGTGHIALATGSGDPESFLAMAGTLGYFTIETVESQ